MLLAIFLIGIAILMLLIIKFKVNPFLALIFTSILMGFGSGMNVTDISSNIASDVYKRQVHRRTVFWSAWAFWIPYNNFAFNRP